MVKFITNCEQPSSEL